LHKTSHSYLTSILKVKIIINSLHNHWEVDKLGRVVHFDIDSDNPQKTIEFYRKIFNWEFKKWDGPMDYWLIMTGDEKKPGIDGGLSKKSDGALPKCPTIDVENLDKTITEIVENGGKIIAPKSPVPKVGWLAYFQDPDGNMFGAMQDDPNAE
jgi:predicted enzyme related to lactoylglutathione lyase